MCMLTYFPEGVQPDAEGLKNGAIFNDDGHGFAIVSRGQLIVQHSMDADYLIAEFVRQRAKHADGPALFHSRFGTGGTVNKFNCHPFRIGKDRKTVLAHNGVLPEVVQPRKGDKRCDTRITAEDVLKGLPLGNATVREEIEKWMGTRNKFVFLTVNPRYERNGYILNESAGVWHQGIWYSNHDFESYQSALSRKYTFAWADYEDEHCVNCSSPHIDWDRAVCTDCMTCQDCLEDFEDNCMCAYVASRKGKEEEEAQWWAKQEADAEPGDDIDVLDLDIEPDRERDRTGAWSLD